MRACGVRHFLGLTTQECVEYTKALHDASEVVPIFAHTSGEPFSADSDDDPVIHTAIAGSAEVICTLDRHLRTKHVRDYCQQRGIEILTDIELLQRLREHAHLD